MTDSPEQPIASARDTRKPTHLHLANLRKLPVDLEIILKRHPFIVIRKTNPATFPAV